jgi:hypothetical protein
MRRDAGLGSLACMGIAMDALAKERVASPADRNDETTLVCLACGDTMKQVRTIPRFGSLRQLGVFVCPSCNQTLTVGISERVP